MPHRVVFTPSAKQDVREARDWYDRTGLELGTAFVKEVLSLTDRIASDPRQFAEAYRDVRQSRLKRFPYVVSYRVSEEQVEVLAVLHGYRDPQVWKKR